VRLGGSPRASVALYRASQAHAFLDGRGFVLPDDVKAVATAVLNHRIVLDLDSSLRGATTIEIVQRVLDTVPAPVLDGDSTEAVASGEAVASPQ
jgi:MoxR-like ATPase